MHLEKVFFKCICLADEHVDKDLCPKCIFLLVNLLTKMYGGYFFYLAGELFPKIYVQSVFILLVSVLREIYVTSVIVLVVSVFKEIYDSMSQVYLSCWGAS